MLSKIKFIAAYRTQPESKVTHYAPVARIEPYGEPGKYKLIVAEPAKDIGPIPFGDAPQGSMRGPRYMTLKKFLKARKLTDLFLAFIEYPRFFLQRNSLYRRAEYSTPDNLRPIMYAPLGASRIRNGISRPSAQVRAALRSSRFQMKT
jgi:hypothetical protein